MKINYIKAVSIYASRIVVASILLAHPIASHCQVKVINAGVPGDTSGLGLARLNRDVLAQHPSLTVVFFGMNDAGNPRKHTPPEVLKKNLTTIVNSLKQASSAVILVNVNPVVDELNKPKQTPESLAYLNEQGGYNQMVSRMNVEIASVAQSEGVPLYDYNAAMKSGAYDATKPGALISGDGIHPSPAGLQLLAEGVAYIIREKKYDTSVIVCFGDSITHGSYPEELQNSLEDGKNSH